MALTQYIDEKRIDVMYDGTVIIRSELVVEDSGVEVSRHPQQPREADYGNLAEESQLVQSIVSAIGTFLSNNPNPAVPSSGLYQQVEELNEVLSDGQIRVRLATAYYNDGELLTKKYHRVIFRPSDSPSIHTARSQAISAVVHTQTIKDQWDAFIASSNLE